MLTAIVGLTAALTLGSADFFGGLAAKRISPVRVTGIAAVTGLALLLIATIFIGGAWSPAAVLWGGLSGISGAIAIVLLYSCLAVGPMSILSPLTAIVGASVPMFWGLISGERFQPLGYLGLVLALIAVVLVGFVPEKGAVRASTRGILMAIGSGVMIGLFLVFINATPDDSGLIPLVMNRSVNAAIMFIAVGILALMHRRTRADAAGSGWRAGLRLAVTCGVIDATGNVLVLIGLRMGDLSVLAVLTAMYPAGTILLASTVLRERIAPVQWLGLLLALAAAALLSLA